MGLSRFIHSCAAVSCLVLHSLVNILTLANATEKVTGAVCGSNARQQQLYKIRGKVAPCPIINSEWSLMNTLDHDFSGFKGTHLSEYKPSHKRGIIGNSCLLVLRDICLAAKLAYEDPYVIGHICRSWGMKTSLDLFFSSKKGTQAFIMYDKQNIVLSFRGTEMINKQDWTMDLKLDMVPMRSANGAGPDEASKVPKAHHGFLEALELVNSDATDTLYSKIYSIVNTLRTKGKKNRKLWITGHSMGGALASIFVAQSLLDNDDLIDSIAGLFTFGQPRCGDAEYCHLFSDMIERGLVFRAVNGKDMVAAIPCEYMKYRHHGCGLDLSSSKLVMTFQEKQYEALLTYNSAPPPQPPTSLKTKIIWAMVPNCVKDHLASAYIGNIQRFME